MALVAPAEQIIKLVSSSMYLINFQKSIKINNRMFLYLNVWLLHGRITLMCNWYGTTHYYQEN